MDGLAQGGHERRGEDVQRHDDGEHDAYDDDYGSGGS
jgi:hypothetical protein